MNMNKEQKHQVTTDPSNVLYTLLDTGFWFIEYNIDCELWDNKKRNQCVSDQHPFEWLKFLSKISSFNRTLVSWKEITEEEYKSGKEILGIG